MGQTPERFTYDVFLSFRGQDVRNGFLSHLHKSFLSSGINTFKDDEELERGAGISPSLLKAIENSRVHLVVLSKNYASSQWCLKELVHIMECFRKDSGQIVLPVFYNVDPSHVRRQLGSFGEAFNELKSRYPEKEVQEWKDALTRVANLSGFHSDSREFRDDADLIKKVIKDITQKLSMSYMQLPAYAVGIRPRAQQIYKRMCFGSDDVRRTIGICGMGGIGKTTLAKAAYNEFSARFDGTCFLENFGDMFKKPQGKVDIQRKLLSDILRRDDIGSNNLDHEVKQRFCNKRVLVVIDDVEDKRQLDSVAIDLCCFGPGSRIIITSRNKHLLEQLGIEDIYSVETLNDDESLELVSRHAFRTSEPPEEFLPLSKKLVEYCENLPLAIEVLGAFLFNKSIIEWKSALERLKRNPDRGIQAKLQVSFDALDEVDKDIFLDISCFFIGMDRNYVSCILNGCEFYPDIGLSVLKDRCLITVRDNKLIMHDLLRDMGRQIVRGTSRKEPEKWSRLWDRVDVINVLENDEGTNATEGLSLKAEVTPVDNLEVEAFSELKKLRLLQLSHVHLKGNYKLFPKGLRWLCWFKFPLDSIPTDLYLRKLVVMDMQHSNLKRLWDVQKQPQLLELKYLDLSHSIQLTDTPDFESFPNLEKLLLINCESLVEVHNSIGTLHKKLVLINLSGCTELGELPLKLYRLKSLKTLILSGCSKLARLDDALGEMESLTTLKADNTALTQIPSSIGQLKKLEELSLDGCKGLFEDRDCTHSIESPQAAPPILLSLNGLSCLKTLSLASCNLSDESVPDDLKSLSCLEKLDLHGNNFRDLLTDFAGLLSLQILRVDSCSNLQSMFSLPKTLRSFYASHCSMLERTPDLSECSRLRSLHLTNCYKLVETPGLDKLETVGIIHMEMCNSISATYREKIMQGWAVGAYGGIFIPGSSLPNWVSFETRRLLPLSHVSQDQENSISFRVPGFRNLDVVGFNLWASYMSQQDNVLSGYSPKITVRNQTTEDVWSRNPAADHIRMYNKTHIWQGHFSYEDVGLETGDKVEVSVDFGDEVTILETAVTFAYRKDLNSRFLQSSSETVSQNFLADSASDTPEKQLIQIVAGFEELVLEESQSRPRKKIAMGLKTLLGAFGLLTFIVIVLVRKHGGPLHGFFLWSWFLRFLGFKNDLLIQSEKEWNSCTCTL